MTNIYIGSSATTGSSQATINLSQYVAPVPETPTTDTFGYESLRKSSILGIIGTISFVIMNSVF